MNQTKIWHWAALFVCMIAMVGKKKAIIWKEDIKQQIDLMDLDIEFLGKCPTCGGKMSENNKFCCHACYLMSATAREC